MCFKGFKREPRKVRGFYLATVSVSTDIRVFNMNELL